VLGAQPHEVGADVRRGAVAREEFLHPRPCIREKNVVDELDGRRCALDVQQDGADVAQLDTVRSGRYVGPRQTGW
jgi:hypothetical protein